MGICLEAEPAAKEYFNCIDAMMATMAAFYKRDYELMFLGSWGFLYNQNAENFSLRIRFGVDRYSRETLKQYHGVASAWSIVGSVAQLVECARRSLENGNPMGLYMNAYYCPWNPAYRRFSINHYVIVTGLDEEKGELLCVDPYSLSGEQRRVSLDQLRKGFHEIIEFRLEKEPTLPGMKELLAQNFYCRRGKPRFDRQCEDIRRLARDLPGDLDLQRELAGYQGDLKNALIFRQISNVSKHRTKTAVGLRYMARRYGCGEALAFADALEKAAADWNRVNTLLFKLHFTKKEELKPRISRLLYEIAGFEENAADGLIRFGESL